MEKLEFIDENGEKTQFYEGTEQLQEFKVKKNVKSKRKT